MNEEEWPYKEPVCKGSFALGTACGKCERCKEYLDKGQDFFKKDFEVHADGVKEIE